MSDPALKRSLPLHLVLFYGLGTMLGAGIYALVGEVAARADMRAPLAFLVAAAIAALTALSYAELSTRHPRSAGEAVYVQEGFGRPWLAMAVGLLVVLTGVVSAAAIANSFVGYVRVFIELPRGVVIVGLVLPMGALAAWGITESLRAAMIVTLVEVAGLLLMVWAARDGLAQLPQRLGELAPGWRAEHWSGIGLGAFLAFYAFIGFEDMVNIAEEVEDPCRVMPRALVGALALATGLYVLVALAAVLAVPPAELGASDAPMALVYERGTGRAPTVITLISLVAVTNGALVQIIMGSRILYGLSRRGWLPRLLGRVNPATRTPLWSTAVVVGVVLVLALAFPLVHLAEATTFVILIVFGLVNLALLRIKRRGPAPEGARVYPAWVPIAGAAACAMSLAFKVATWIGK